MDEERIKGAAKKVEGSVKDAAGKLTGDAKLQAEGKIRHVGLCNVGRGELERAQQIVSVVSVQNRYNVGERGSERVLEACQEQGLGFLPWFPLGSGDLAQPGGRLDHVARNHNATSGQVALAWLLRHSPVMLPIPGTSSVAHLEENMQAA